MARRRRWPRTEPCGTPTFSGLEEEKPEDTGVPVRWKGKQRKPHEERLSRRRER